MIYCHNTFMGTYCSQQHQQEESPFEIPSNHQPSEEEDFSQMLKCKSSNMTIRIREARYSSARLAKNTKTREDLVGTEINSYQISKTDGNPQSDFGSLKFPKAGKGSELGSQENECSSPNLGCTNQIKQELLSMINKEKMGIFQNQKAAKEIEQKLQQLIIEGSYKEEQLGDLRQQLQIYTDLMLEHESNLQKIKKMR